MRGIATVEPAAPRNSHNAKNRKREWEMCEMTTYREG